MPRTNDTFSWSGILNWADPHTDEAFSITGWNALRDDLAASLSQSFRRDGQGTMSGPFLAVSGSQGAPGISFSGDPDTGIYSEGSNVLNITTAGAERLSITATEMTLQQPIHAADGSLSTPGYSFEQETNTGFRRQGAGGAFDAVVSGAAKLTFGSTQLLASVPYRANGGTAGTPSLSFSGNEATGFYSKDTDRIGIAAGGVEVGSLVSSGLRGRVNTANWTGLDLYNSADVRRATLALTSTNNIELHSYNPATNAVFIYDYNSETFNVYPQVRTNNGSAAAPAYSFLADPYTGMYLGAVDQLVLGVGNTPRLTLGTGYCEIAHPVFCTSGNAAGPGIRFSSDTDTGIFSDGDNRIGFASGGNPVANTQPNGLALRRPAASWTGLDFVDNAGTRRGLLSLESNNDLILRPYNGGSPLPILVQHVSATGATHTDTVWRFPNGGSVAPAISFQNAASSGIYHAGSNEVGVSVNNTALYRFTATGLTGPATGVASADNNYSTNAGVKSYVDALPTFSGAVADGSAGVPGLRFTSDPDTGLFRDTANEINVSLGGTERYTFTSTGLVGPSAVVSTGAASYVSAAEVKLLTHATGLFKSTHTTTATSATKVTGWGTGANFTRNISSFGLTAPMESSGDITCAGPDGTTYEVHVSGWVDGASGLNDMTVEVRVDGSSFTAPPLKKFFRVDGATFVEFSIHGIVAVDYGHSLALFVHASTSSSRTINDLLFTVKRII